MTAKARPTAEDMVWTLMTEFPTKLKRDLSESVIGEIEPVTGDFAAKEMNLGGKRYHVFHVVVDDQMFQVAVKAVNRTRGVRRERRLV